VEYEITVTASDRLQAVQFEPIDRSVTITFKIPASDGEPSVETLREIIHRNQLIAEAQMYAALHRDMMSRGKRADWILTAANDRYRRIGQPEAIEEQCRIGGAS